MESLKTSPFTLIQHPRCHLSTLSLGNVNVHCALHCYPFHAYPNPFNIYPLLMHLLQLSYFQVTWFLILPGAFVLPPDTCSNINLDFEEGLTVVAAAGRRSPYDPFESTKGWGAHPFSSDIGRTSSRCLLPQWTLGRRAMPIATKSIRLLHCTLWSPIHRAVVTFA